MTITHTKFLDLGNGLKINIDLVEKFDEKTQIAYLKNGEKYVYGEFIRTYTYADNLFNSKKGDNEWYIKQLKEIKCYEN